MEAALLILGFTRDAALQLVPLFQRLIAEGRDPTPDESAILKAAQKREEDEFNKDLK